jgi:hypothetical protein
MFSFLRETWAPHDFDSSDDDTPSSNKKDESKPSTPIEDAAVSVMLDISDISVSSIESEPHARISQLEEQNARMVSQLSSLQGIITSKSSLYLDYKAKYEVRYFIFILLL